MPEGTTSAQMATRDPDVRRMLRVRDHDDEAAAVGEVALDYARREWGAIAEQIDTDDTFPDGLWRGLGEMGFLGAAIPEEYGGAGGDLATAAAICEAFARVCPAIALSYGAHLNLCAHNILRNGGGARRQREAYAARQELRDVVALALDATHRPPTDLPRNGRGSSTAPQRGG